MPNEDTLCPAKRLAGPKCGTRHLSVKYGELADWALEAVAEGGVIMAGRWRWASGKAMR